MMKLKLKGKKKLIKSKLKKNYGIQFSIKKLRKRKRQIGKKAKRKGKKIIIVYSVLWGKIQ